MRQRHYAAPEHRQSPLMPCAPAARAYWKITSPPPPWHSFHPATLQVPVQEYTTEEAQPCAMQLLNTPAQLANLANRS
jgi:hypothetical protein